MRAYWLGFVRGLSSPLVVLLLLAACGGGGGDEGGGGNGGGNSPPAPMVVSGAVQAPSGQVAFFRQQSRFDRFAALFGSVAYAAVTGLSPVPDGTPVQLGRMTTGGAVSILASTTTSGGRYSFNLTSAGLAFASDLIVQVINTATGTRMRAFVITANVDITPGSESAVQLVLERIALTPGTGLANLTLQELNDFVGAIDALTASNQMAAGLDINSTVSFVKNGVTNDPGIAAFLTSALAPGQTTDGPGDAGNFVPFAQGNIWVYQGTEQSGGQSPIAYSNTATLSGTKLVGGILTTVLSESNPLNIGGPQDEYYSQNSRGMTYHGSSDATDVLNPQLIPYLTLRFPFGTGSTFDEINKKGLNFGEDLDGDFINEKLDLVSTVTVKGFETVTVPAGTFPNCAKVETVQTFSVILSRNGQRVTVQGAQTIWWAPGVGAVKRVFQVEDLTDTEQLIASIVAATFFGPATSFPSGSVHPSSVAIEDFNLDGKLDLAVTNQGSPSIGFTDSSVSVLLGDGTGSFGSATNFLAGSVPSATAAGDFNGDGRPDLAVANFSSSNVSVLLGNGDGTFGAPTDFPLMAQLNPTSVVVGDFNSDGKLDLAVAISFGFSNATPGYVSILLGNGNGTFGAATNFAVGGAPRSAVVGDFNSDGKLDLAVANSLSGSVSVLLGNGTGAFSAAANFAAGDRPSSIAVADFNGDAKLDLAVATNSFVGNNSNVSILLGDGTGSFGTATPFVVDSVMGADLTSVAVGDFNGDGKLDLAAANAATGGIRSNNVSILLGNGAGSFRAVSYFVDVEGGPTFVAVGNFDVDGKPDLAVANSNNVSIFINTAP